MKHHCALRDMRHHSQHDIRCQFVQSHRSHGSQRMPMKKSFSALEKANEHRCRAARVQRKHQLS
eukprot:1175925-Lingulodinium_polyedra.AAC.1